ncbi:MAG: hypothetical protein A2167_01070 [Planctomycetes bacterium RBG_13_46_10]|nr:MAG: hypothetical protein A2167_01070 [Planctomycetes bacterium RBG_13_46_10]
MTSRNTTLLIMLMSLMTVAIADAAPTINNTNHKLAAQSVSPAYPTDNSSVEKVELFNGTSNSALADIAAELLKPPADFTNPPALPAGTKPLPAVPAALFMGLTGFMCVTLVRDHKVWLAVLTGLLWAGQAGFTALPQAASYLVSRNYLNQHSQQQNYYITVQKQARLRSDFKGTEYISLLHYLEGIPTKIRNTKHDIRYTILIPRIVEGHALNIVSPYLIQTLNCLAFQVRRFYCFSPAFIFEAIPRGPPKLILS